MDQIEIEASYKSPRVVFDPVGGLLSIEGKSILVKVEEFYRPLLDWFDNFVEIEDLPKIEFTFDIEYFNLASTKRFLYFLVKLKQLKEEGKDVTVNWVYSSNDKYVFEMGEDLSQMLKMPFNFVGYERLKEKVFSPN
jgi:hypothetical protein